MKLKLRKKLPKIVLAQSLACTAILANGLYNNRNNTVSAEVTAEEYIHAIEVLGGEKVSEEEQEKIKKLFQRDTVKKLSESGEKFYQLVQKIKALNLDENSLRDTEKELQALNLDCLKDESLESIVKKEAEDLKKWILELKEEDVKQLISKLEGELESLEIASENKIAFENRIKREKIVSGAITPSEFEKKCQDKDEEDANGLKDGKSYNCEPGEELTIEFPKSEIDNREIVDVAIEKIEGRIKETVAPTINYQTKTISRGSEVDELRIEQDENGATYMVEYQEGEPGWQDIPDSGVVRRNYKRRPEETKKIINSVMVINVEKNIKLISYKFNSRKYRGAPIFVNVKPGVVVDKTKFFPGNSLYLIENANGEETRNIIEERIKEYIAKSFEIVPDMENGEIQVRSYALGSVEVEATFKYRDKTTGEYSEDRKKFIVNSTLSITVPEIPVQNGTPNEINVYGAVEASLVRIKDVHFEAANDLVVSNSADGGKWIESMYKGKENRIVPIKLDLAIAYNGLTYMYKVSTKVIELSPEVKFYTLDDRNSHIKVYNENGKTLVKVSKKIPICYESSGVPIVVGGSDVDKIVEEVEPWRPIVIDYRREKRVDSIEKETSVEVNAPLHRAPIYLMVGPGARGESTSIFGDNVVVYNMYNKGENLNGTINAKRLITDNDNYDPYYVEYKKLYEPKYDEYYYLNKQKENQGIFEQIDRCIGVVASRWFWDIVAGFSGSGMNLDEKQERELKVVWREMEQITGTKIRDWVIEPILTGPIWGKVFKIGGKIVLCPFKMINKEAVAFLGKEAKSIYNKINIDIPLGKYLKKGFCAIFEKTKSGIVVSIAHVKNGLVNVTNKYLLNYKNGKLFVKLEMPGVYRSKTYLENTNEIKNILMQEPNKFPTSYPERYPASKGTQVIKVEGNLGQNSMPKDSFIKQDEKSVELSNKQKVDYMNKETELSFRDKNRKSGQGTASNEKSDTSNSILAKNLKSEQKVVGEGQNIENNSPKNDTTYASKDNASYGKNNANNSEQVQMKKAAGAEGMSQNSSRSKSNNAETGNTQRNGSANDGATNLPLPIRTELSPNEQMLIDAAEKLGKNGTLCMLDEDIREGVALEYNLVRRALGHLVQKGKLLLHGKTYILPKYLDTVQGNLGGKFTIDEIVKKDLALKTFYELKLRVDKMNGIFRAKDVVNIKKYHHMFRFLVEKEYMIEIGNKRSYCRTACKEQIEKKLNSWGFSWEVLNHLKIVSPKRFVLILDSIDNKLKSTGKFCLKKIAANTNLDTEQLRMVRKYLEKKGLVRFLYKDGKTNYYCKGDSIEKKIMTKTVKKIDKLPKDLLCVSKKVIKNFEWAVNKLQEKGEICFTLKDIENILWQEEKIKCGDRSTLQSALKFLEQNKGTVIKIKPKKNIFIVPKEKLKVFEDTLNPFTIDKIAKYKGLQLKALYKTKIQIDKIDGFFEIEEGLSSQAIAFLVKEGYLQKIDNNYIRTACMKQIEEKLISWGLCWKNILNLPELFSAKRFMLFSEKIFETIAVSGQVCSTNINVVGIPRGCYTFASYVLRYLKDEGILIEKEKIGNTIYYILAK